MTSSDLERAGLHPDAAAKGSGVSDLGLPLLCTLAVLWIVAHSWLGVL